MLLARSKDGVQLKKRGFNMRVDDVAGIVPGGCWVRHVKGWHVAQARRVQNACRGSMTRRAMCASQSDKI